MKQASFFFLLLLLLAAWCAGCGMAKEKKIFYLNSYHKGYAASDSVEAGLRRTLSPAILTEAFYLDAKQLRGEAVDSMASLALQAIRVFQPDVIIASDDDAVKRVIVPSFKNSATPVVFCGVNWSAASYGLPVENVTGMLEVLPLEKIINVIQQHFPQCKSLLVLSENSVSEQKNKEVLDTLFRRLGLTPQYRLVNDFTAWKEEFAAANKTADLIYLPTNGAIKNWNKEEAVRFVEDHIQKPVFTCDDFMMPYAVIGLTKVASEQGEWAAKAAVQILGGTKPTQIPVAKNKEQKGWFNPGLAQKIGWKPDEKFSKDLQIVH